MIVYGEDSKESTTTGEKKKKTQELINEFSRWQDIRQTYKNQLYFSKYSNKQCTTDFKI